jgi:SAM-dependent methyltransferase
MERLEIKNLMRNAVGKLRQLYLWTNPFRYALGSLRESIAGHVSTLQLDQYARVLDYGCGSKHYRELFPPDCDYLGADLPGNPKADLVLDDNGRIPMPDASCNLVLSTQVLEHVEDPAAYLLECLRVLKPGGKLLLTTHGLMFYHPFPFDLWRWTADGLKLTVERSGMRVLTIEGVVGLVPTAIWLVMFELQARLPRGLRHLFVFVSNLLMYLSDRMTSDASRLRNANTFTLMAQRPPI